jgi:cobyrinic acid a,c-diamide synthase
VGLIIAGERSGVGKTTVTLALLAWLRRCSDRVQSFKVGPDYIDLMFHRAITGRPGYTLDPVLTTEAYVRQCYRRQCAGMEFAVVEGVMGLFDGGSPLDDIASTAHVARLLSLPVLLVVDCARLSGSVAALVQGYRTFDQRVRLAGVVLNRVGSDRHLGLLRGALAAIDVPILGVLRREAAIQLPDRHLGLVPAGELSHFQAIAERLADLGQHCFDWSQLLPLVRVPQAETATPEAMPEVAARRVRIAIATDAAFNFYYPDNLAQLTRQGAELVFWSPLAETLPADVEGLYLGGGFPEMFAEALAQNQPARQSVQSAVAAGLPTYAECGGLMYLCEHLIDFDGRAWPMAAALPATVAMTGKLSLGYRQATTLTDGPLALQGAQVIGHEFHRSQVQTTLTQPIYRSQPYFLPTPAQPEGWCQGNLHASYLHLHWGARPELPQRFVRHCRQYRQRRVK